MRINWKVNNPSVLQNYSPGYKLFVNCSILSKILFKKCHSYSNYCVSTAEILFMLFNKKDAYEIKGRIEDYEISTFGSIWVFGTGHLCWLLCRTCPGPSFGLAALQASWTSRWLHSPVEFQHLSLHAQIKHLLASKLSEDLCCSWSEGKLELGQHIWAISDTTNKYTVQNSHSVQHNSLTNSLPDISVEGK